MESPDFRSPDADDDVLAREHAHYQEHKRYLLHFLDLDDTRFDRWLIRQVLRTWDRQLFLLDPGLISGKRTVEVGCGNPRILFHFLQLGAREAVGIDLAPAFVERGLHRPLTYAGPGGVAVRPGSVRFLYGDVNGPVTAGLTCDTLVCFQALHHIDLPRFAETCARIVADGGHVVLSDPVGDHPLRKLGDLVGRASGLLSPDERARTAMAVLRMFEARGFEQILFRSLNPTLEIFFQITELLPLPGRLAFYLKAPMALLRGFEDILEEHVLRRMPRLGWRYFMVLRKAAAPQGRESRPHGQPRHRCAARR